MKGKISTRTREYLCDKSKGRCWYCGCVFTPYGPQRMVVDHVTPVARGGKNTMDNFVACCNKCNSTKGNRSIEYLRTRLWLDSIEADWLPPALAERFIEWMALYGFDAKDYPEYVFYFEGEGL